MEKMRQMIRWLTFLVILSLALTGVYLGGQRGSLAYERMLVSRIGHGLSVLDVDWITLSADGLRVEMRGRAPSLDAQALAAETAQATAPWAQIIDRTAATISPPPPREPIEVELLLDDLGLTATGRFYEPEMRDAFAQSIATVAPDITYHDLTGTNAAPPGSKFGREIEVVAAAIPRLTQAFIRLAPGVVEIDGMVPDDPSLRQLQTDLLGAAGSDVSLTLGLRVPPQVVIPFRFAAWKDFGGTKIETCVARNANEQAAIVGALRSYGVTDHATGCAVGLGGPDVAWGEAVLAGLLALDEVNVGRFELTYSSALFEVSLPADQLAFERLAATLADNLPAGIDLTSDFDTEETGIAVPRDAYWLRITEADGEITLAGRMPGNVAREALVTYAAAIRSREAVSDALAISDRDAPPDWQLAAQTALDATRTIGDLQANITAGKIDLTGQIGGSAEAGRLHRRLIEALPNHEVSTRFVVDLPAIVERLPLDKAACLSQLNGEMDAQPIGFETGSAVIDEGSLPLMDRLAEILMRCGRISIEIAGHTDSQGSETFNQKLSQSRAESVRDSLRETLGTRRLTLDTLLAAGYGEAQPVASNQTPEGRAANRRIEFRLIED